MLDSPSDPPGAVGVPFSFFVSLVREIGTLKPVSIKAGAWARYAKKGGTTGPEYPALTVFNMWVNELRRRFTPVPPGTTAICFRLLFPEEDWMRKYNIQEARLTKLLADCYGWGIDRLDGWRHEESSGCLGDELKHALQRTCPYEGGYESSISIGQVSELLDQLAALSKYSNSFIKNKRGDLKNTAAKDIIRKLFRPLAPLDAAVMAQIILKDLRPLLYPLTEFHYTTALINFNTASVKMLIKEHAMNAWDPSRRLTRYYRVCTSLDEAAAFADNPENTQRDVKPAYGHPIAVPKSEKGQNVSHALNMLSSADWIWAETKYDGERAQIHVRIGADGTPEITIFSKSRRDSTRDRAGIHRIILQALGLSSKSFGKVGRKPAFKENVILDAEMVAFSGDKVAEFYHISRLIGATAEGERARHSSCIRTKGDVSTQDHDEDGDESANEGFNESVALGVVFFDVLYLDSESHMGRPYSERRELLESLIHVSPGSAILASRWLIPLSDNTAAEYALRWIFSRHIASHEEGMVLKASESFYNDYNLPWVKLKKDYIPGHGDTVDMAVVGASWEKIRGRSLRVPPSTYTTFLVAALENKNEINQGTNKPSFGSYFTVGYGLDRRQLEGLNFRIKSSSISFAEYQKQIDARTNNLWIDNLPKAMEPTVVLCEPLLVELFGAGFTKTAYSRYYELRFPRISKIYRPIERSWREGLSCDELDDIARASVGRDSRAIEMDNEGRAMFGQPLLPSVKSETQFKQRLLCAYNELATSEGKALCDSSSLQIISEFPVDSSLQPTADPAPSQSLACPLLSKTNIVVGDADQTLNPSFASSADPEITLSIPRPPSIASEATSAPQSLKRALLTQNLDKLNYAMQSNPSMPLTPPPSSPLVPPTKQLKRRSEDPGSQAADRPAKRAKTEPSSPDPASILPSAVATASPPDIELDSTFVHFALPRGSGCASFRASKKLVERPVHGMRSMLYGSGWLEQWDGVREDVYKAVIIIDECDTSAAFHWMDINELLTKEAATPPPTRRLPVLVYGCRSPQVLARYD